MKNDLVLILAYKRVTVADVHEATGVPVETIVDNYYQLAENTDVRSIAKICDYLNITLEEYYGRKIRPVRNQYRQDLIFKELVYKVIAVDEVIRKEETDD